MQFSEIIKMALASLGANKLRAALTMAGITIGVFSIIAKCIAQVGRELLVCFF